MTRSAASVPTPAAPPRPGATRPLFSVAMRHDYYNDDEGGSGDLELAPTPACAATMRRFGIAWKSFGGETLIAVAEAGLPALRDRIARDRGWTRLTFTLRPRSAGFLDITALPLASGAEQKLYLGNIQATEAGGCWTVGGADGITGDLLCPSAGGRLVVPARGRRMLGLTDMAGTLVARVPAVAGSAVFDLAGQAAGLYRVVPLRLDGTPAATRRAGPNGFVYLPGAAGAIGLVDLLLAPPTGTAQAPSAFPIGADGAVTRVAIKLRFAARRTVWQYYVVAQRGTLAPDAAIAGDGARFTRSAVTLPGGAVATLFTADTPLPLRRSSPYRYQLSGARHAPDGGRTEVTIARLPVAPPSPVWPVDNGDPLTGRSEIYVYV